MCLSNSTYHKLNDWFKEENQENMLQINKGAEAPLFSIEN